MNLVSIKNKKKPLIMKKFVLLAVFLQTVALFGQNESPAVYKNAFFLDPLGFFGSGIQLGYERNIGEYNGLKLEAGYYTKDDPWVYDAESMNGFNVQLFYKRYFDATAIKKMRFYFGAMAIYKQIDLKGAYDYDVVSENEYSYTEKRDMNANAYGGGILFGTNVMFENHFYMDYSFGGTILATESDPDDVEQLHLGLINPYKSGITPRFNIAIGYAF